MQRYDLSYHYEHMVESYEGDWVRASDALEALQATATSTQWETRYKALVGALVEACEVADRSYTINAVDTNYIREIIERNP